VLRSAGLERRRAFLTFASDAGSSERAVSRQRLPPSGSGLFGGPGIDRAIPEDGLRCANLDFPEAAALSAAKEPTGAIMTERFR
jgi:hypothetical protein